MSSRLALPAAAELEVLLRDITERLAAELGSPGVHAPVWSPLEWTLARAVAAIHGVSPLLAGALPWSGPDEWCAFLASQRRHTLGRHRRFAALLDSVHAAASAAELPFVALKGAALHTLGLYRAGERPMADLDLLVRPGDADRFAALFGPLELCEVRRSARDREFAPHSRPRPPAAIGEHRDNFVKIELHLSVNARLAVQSIDLSAHLFPREPRHGLNGYPSRAALMGHLLLHAACDMAAQALRLLQLNDLALVASILSESEWEALLATEVQGHAPWWAYPPLRLTTRYFPGIVPQDVLERLAALCPARLRRVYAHQRLARVSFSHVWVDAFPGMAWTRSIGETLRYAFTRLVPSDEVRRGRHLAQEADVGRRDWSHLSQIERLARFLVERPVRPRTMRVLEAALVETR